MEADAWTEGNAEHASLPSFLLQSTVDDKTTDEESDKAKDERRLGALSEALK